MENSEKDRLATAVVDRWCSFQDALAGAKRKYLLQDFLSFADAARRHIEVTRDDQLVRRDVANAVNPCGATHINPSQFSDPGFSSSALELGYTHCPCVVGGTVDSFERTAPASRYIRFNSCFSAISSRSSAALGS